MKRYFEIAQEKFNNLKTKQDVVVLAFESSCDDTCVALVKNGRELISHAISSQIEIHKRFGGVVPEVASRNHLLAITNILEKVMAESKLTYADIDAIAVTYGAGLSGALMVSVNFAKSLAFALKLPLIKVNHIKAHVSANYVCHKDLEPPFLSLIVSGGHTALVEVKDYVNNELIETTHDDAIGEAYDKVAKVLGLDYPGGPIIEKHAKNGNPNIEFISKPTSLSIDRVFSFSGLKSAVINYLHKLEQNGEKANIDDVCASFQKQAIDIVANKSINYAVENGYDKIVLAGGVACNHALRERLEKLGSTHNIKVLYPTGIMCTDNAVMVGSEAYNLIKSGEGLADLDLNANPSINLKFVK